MAKTGKKAKRKTSTGKKHLPRLIAWETTKRCNLACVHCRASATQEAAPDELTTREGRKLLKNLTTVGAPIVILTGGEPLLREDIFEIAAAGTELGLPMALATNGTLIDDNVAKQIIESGIQRCAISIDGVKSSTHDRLRGVKGSFDSTIRAASVLRAHGIDFQINTSVTRENEPELPQMAGLFEALGASAWHVFMVVPVGRAVGIGDDLVGKTRYNEILHWLAQKARETQMQIKPTCAPQYHRIVKQKLMYGETQLDGHAMMTRGCLAGTGFAFISATGDVQPCGYFPVIAGNTREYTFGTIWRASALFLKLRDHEQYNGRCGVCEFFNICGGCRARALAATGDFMNEDPYCNYLPGTNIS